MEEGDVILVATDGVFDNVPEGVLVAELQRAQGECDAVALQAVANSIAWMARNLSFDGEFMSPFAKNARQNGIDAIGNLHLPSLYCFHTTNSYFSTLRYYLSLLCCL